MVRQIHELPSHDIKNVFQLLGFVRRVNNDGLAFTQQAIEDYGEFFYLNMMGDMALFVANPDLIHEILVTKASSFIKDNDYRDTERGLARFLGFGILTSDGEFWKKQRKLVQPAFHTQRIKSYADTMVQYTHDMLDNWRDGAQLDIAHEMMKVTLRIVGRTLFDLDTQAHTATIEDAMEAANRTAGQHSMVPVWVPTPGELRTRRAVKGIDAVTYDIIQQRRAENADRGDLLSVLLMATDDDGTPMSDKQVRDEAVTLFLAGHETTANALNWTFWLLAQNPDKAAKLHAEVDGVLQGRAATYDDLKALPYTEMVVKESMRLMPPVPGVGRQAADDVQIGDVHVPKNTALSVFFIHMHRAADYWPDAEQFLPERWLPENADQINRRAYLPFGNGARVCVGNSFTMMEAQLLLATIAQHYDLALLPGHTVKPEFRITMYPKGGLPMIAKRRTPAPVAPTPSPEQPMGV